MTNPKKTEIVVLVDRSGSMGSCIDDANGGLNAFVNEQKKVEGDVNFTYIQFDDNYEVVHNAIPLKEVPKLVIQPRGGTALFDSIVRAVRETGERFAKMSEADRPGLVLFVILTDGGENASREFTRYNGGLEKVKEVISHQDSVYNWKFSYLGSNQDGFAVGNSMGVKSAATYDPEAPSKAFASTSGKFARMRSMYNAGNESALISNEYTKQELDAMVE